MAEAYNKLSENHRHERGPWTLMTNHAISHTNAIGNDNPIEILDIATGPGEPAKSLAQAIPHATIIASDVSEDMIAAATKNTQDLTNIKCLLADSQNLSMLESNSIDLVTCCYGFMFPTDKPAALAETYRVLKPGGTLIATTWDRVDILKICRDVMKAVLGHDPPPPPLNPMSLSEEGLFHTLVDEAGFVSIEQSTSTYPFNFGSDREFQFTVATILLRDKINEIAEKDEEAWSKAEKTFWENIDKYTLIEEGSGDMIMPENTFRMTIAKKGV
jgi:ubiquinone/menaquinone biosynthesis C-methylase UbiE